MNKWQIEHLSIAFHTRGGTLPLKEDLLNELLMRHGESRFLEKEHCLEKNFKKALDFTNRIENIAE